MCFMLRKCFKPDEEEGVEIRLNCFVNSSCCAGGTIKDTVENKNEEEEGNGRVGGEVKKDIIRPRSPRRSGLHHCFSCCCKSARESDTGMVEKTTDVHAPSESL